ncbi:UVR8, partial [Symbiodinium pilosum]
AIKRFFIRLALPLFQESTAEKFQLTWCFDSAEITAMAPKTARARLTSFATAKRKLRLKAWRLMRWSRTTILRMGPSFQQAVLRK